MKSDYRGHLETRNFKGRRSEGPTVTILGTAALGLPPGLPCRDTWAHRAFRKRSPESSSGAFIKMLGV